MLKSGLEIPEDFSSLIKRPLKPPVHGVGDGMGGEVEMVMELLGG